MMIQVAWNAPDALRSIEAIARVVPDDVLMGAGTGGGNHAHLRADVSGVGLDRALRRPGDDAQAVKTVALRFADAWRVAELGARGSRRGTRHFRI